MMNSFFYKKMNSAYHTPLLYKIHCQWRDCWNDVLHIKFEEPTLNTEISGKNKNDKTL